MNSSMQVQTSLHSIVEAVSSVQEARVLIQRIHDAGCLASISIKPGTDVEAIKPFLDDLDMVLVMSVRTRIVVAVIQSCSFR